MKIQSGCDGPAFFSLRKRDSKKATNDIIDDGISPNSRKRQQRAREHPELGGGFKCFLFSPLFGEDSHFD